MLIAQFLQDRLSTMIGKSSGFLETLPPQMRARIEFLRELQDKHDDLFDDYNKELKTLREKFEALYGGQHSIHPPSGHHCCYFCAF